MSDTIDFESLIQSKLNNCTANKIHLYFGKKRIEDHEATYNFYKSSTNEPVRNKLLSFLITNLKKLKNENITDSVDEEDNNLYFCFKLEGIDVWKKFEHCVYHENIHKFKDIDENEFNKYKKPIRKIKSVKKLKNNLNHYLLIHEDDNCILGQISRIYPKQAVYDAKKMRIIFDENKFTEITSKPNVEFDEHDSILFYIDRENKFGFTNKIKEYEEIFDMDDQYKTNAINIITQSNFKDYCDIDKVTEIVKNDRNIQRMLNREVTAREFENFDITDIKHSLETFNGFSVEEDYDVIFENDEFIINEKKEKESLRNIIKLVGGYYNPSLNGKYLIEGKPIHIINTRTDDE